MVRTSHVSDFNFLLRVLTIYLTQEAVTDLHLLSSLRSLWTNGHMDEWTHGQMDTWTNGHLDKWTPGQMDTWTHGQMDKWTNVFSLDARPSNKNVLICCLRLEINTHL